MFVKNGVAYAKNPVPSLLKVSDVRPLPAHGLWLRFSDGSEKTFDFSALLSQPAFAPLRDEALFHTVYLDHGVPTWANGEIDIAPEYLYAHGCAQGGACHA